MIDQYSAYLEGLNNAKKEMVSLLKELASIHSGSDNPEGLSETLRILKRAFSGLNGKMEEISLPERLSLNSRGLPEKKPLGKTLSLKKRENAPIKILLLGHMDIALAKAKRLGPLRQIERNKIVGRGVADMKGGLVIMLKALEALENSPFADKIGWQVLINADEEIGSPGSGKIIQRAAEESSLAFIFESSLPDGSLISARKGSLNYSVHFKGKAAHAGRDRGQGVNAINSLLRFASAVESLESLGKDIIVNIGHIEGGELPNIVPQQAFLQLNARVTNDQDYRKTREKIAEIAAMENSRKNLRVTIRLDSERPPKPFNKKTKRLFESLQQSAARLGINLQWRAGGGSTDGNIVAEKGLAVCDSLGVIGGNLHTDREWANLDSLTERAKLSARFLMQLAAGEIKGNIFK